MIGDKKSVDIALGGWSVGYVKDYLKGGNSTAGADAFISGKLWELKKISGSPTSVKNGLVDALKQFERTHPGKPIRVSLDARDALTYETFLQGVSKVQSTQRNRITEIMAVPKDGSIVFWP